MIGVLVTIMLLLLLAFALRATSYRHKPTHDPVVIDLTTLRSYESRNTLPVPVATSELPTGPDASSPFDQGRATQLATGPPPPPGHRPKPGGLPAPDPPRLVGALLGAADSPPTYDACGCDAYSA